MRPSIAPVSQEPRNGLVLSGGGMRGAYEAGVVEGILAALGDRRASPFRVFAGTSVGAINAAYLAASTHLPDLGVGRLREVWSQLAIERHLRLDPLGFLSVQAGFRRAAHGTQGTTSGRSLLDPRALEALIGAHIDWQALRENVAAGRTLSLSVAALDVASGRTTVFTELAPAMDYRPSRDPRRESVLAPIDHNHVLASAAIPVLFPARRIGDTYYCDGGLRFNTPISPAIRAGADRLVVVTLGRRGQVEPEISPTQYPSLLFLAGKVMNALLLDPVVYDLAVLQRVNSLVEVLARVLPDERMAEVERALMDERGTHYRRIETLVFSPSEDLGAIANDHLERHLDSWQLRRIPRWLLNAARSSQADWAAYVLFEGGFAERLMDLGRRDALARSAEIRRFFDGARPLVV